MARPDDLELMQLADGERDDASLAEQIARDAHARAKLEALGDLHEIVSGHLELAVDAMPEHRLAGMWRAIDQAIDQDAATPRGAWARIVAWLDRYRGYVITGAASAGAVAAIAIVMRPGAGGPTASASTRSIEVLPAAIRAAPVVESLDTPDGSGTVMNFEDEDGHTTVIWVTPADTVEGI
jgi:hypothetical protein